MGNILFSLLYQPLYNLLVFFYDLIPAGGLGLAIIIVTIVVKTLVLPLTYKSLKSQKELQEVQPKIKEIREKHKDNQEEMARQLMGVYKEHNVNPFASCLPTIVQLVIFITLYRVLSAGITTVDPSILYSFVKNPESMNHMFLGIDLAAVSIPLAVVAGALQYFQAKQMIATRPPKEVRGEAASLDEDVAASVNKMTLYLLPIMTLAICATTLPAGLTVYIIISTLLTYLMYHFFLGKVRSGKVAQ